MCHYGRRWADEVKPKEDAKGAGADAVWATEVSVWKQGEIGELKTSTLLIRDSAVAAGRGCEEVESG